MYQVSLSDSGHSWTKQNLVTITKGSTPHDIMKCEKCGVEGRVYNLTHIQLSESYSREKAYRCPFWTPDQQPAQIKITGCNAMGAQFGNLTPGSIHAVIDPPDGYKNDPTGVWVMGIGEPVKVLRGEYTTDLT